jgi:hypothetical protein
MLCKLVGAFCHANTYNLSGAIVQAGPRPGSSRTSISNAAFNHGPANGQCTTDVAIDCLLNMARAAARWRLTHVLPAAAQSQTDVRDKWQWPYHCPRAAARGACACTAL